MAKLTKKWLRHIPKEWRAKRDALPDFSDRGVRGGPWGAYVGSKPTPEMGKTTPSLQDLILAEYFYVGKDIGPNLSTFLPAIAVPIVHNMDIPAVLIVYRTHSVDNRVIAPNGCSLLDESKSLPPWPFTKQDWAGLYANCFSWAIDKDFIPRHLCDGWQIYTREEVEEDTIANPWQQAVRKFKTYKKALSNICFPEQITL